MGAEAVQLLAPKPGAVIADGTVGAGGHSLMIVPHLLPQGHLIAVDRDREALDLARKRLTEFTPQITFVHGNYRDLHALLDELKIGGLDGLLLDLGMSSMQVDRPDRGFSFSKDGPLDMRMDDEQEETAESLVNELPAEELARLLDELGEERFARRIAQRIVQARHSRPIRTTAELVRLIAQAVPASARHGRLHVATRTFQALRMAVNDELGALASLLERLPRLLKPGGRAVILAFHSLEDRLVKRAFAQGVREGWWTVLTKKPVPPSAAECSANPRARSAKLRAIERR
ncbi:MAG: 16S rRNA (cytosine(1402)-N(4))-methyltransferase RsmH [Candidatus Omnitrophica bacterium]|nr:16S rRNA (cytosine(1402)-N(4))-methyltransferase RsmH [Candidatus Omnitrophota bacterium]